MSQSFVISVLSFTIVMVLFNIIKDIYISVKDIKISDYQKANIDKRWLISYTIGIILLFVIYGRDGP